MDTKTIIGILASLLALASSLVYIQDIFRGNSKPHIYTWVVWSVVTSIAFLGQVISGGGAGAYPTGVAAVLTIGITLLAVFGGYGSTDIVLFDKICLGLSLVSVLPYLLLNNIFWSVILATLIDIIAFLPTMRKVWRSPSTESLPSMYIDSIKHSFSIYALSTYSFINILYPAAVLMTKFVIITEIYIAKSIQNKKTA